MCFCSLFLIVSSTPNVLSLYSNVIRLFRSSTFPYENKHKRAHIRRHIELCMSEFILHQLNSCVNVFVVWMRTNSLSWTLVCRFNSMFCNTSYFVFFFAFRFWNSFFSLLIRIHSKRNSGCFDPIHLNAHFDGRFPCYFPLNIDNVPIASLIHINYLTKLRFQ